MDIDNIIHIIVTLLFAMALGFIPGTIARKKGHDFIAWWLFGAILFIIALPMALLLDAKAASRNSGTKHCPYCSAKMKTSVMECPKCHRSQPAIGAATDASWQQVRTENDEVAKWAKQKGLESDDTAR